jgi:hypothetical protein
MMVDFWTDDRFVACFVKGLCMTGKDGEFGGVCVASGTNEPGQSWVRMMTPVMGDIGSRVHSCSFKCGYAFCVVAVDDVFVPGEATLLHLSRICGKPSLAGDTR